MEYCLRSFTLTNSDVHQYGRFMKLRNLDHAMKTLYSCFLDLQCGNLGNYVQVKSQAREHDTVEIVLTGLNKGNLFLC